MKKVTMSAVPREKGTYDRGADDGYSGLATTHSGPR